MNLFIDTSSDLTTVAILSDDGNFYDYDTWNAGYNQTEELLPRTERLLKRKDLDVSQIKKILVVRGPGGYTGLRVGLASANALGFAWQIPLVGISSELKDSPAERGKALGSKPNKFLTADYRREPHITSPKDRHRD